MAESVLYTQTVGQSVSEFAVQQKTEPLWKSPFTGTEPSIMKELVSSEPQCIRWVGLWGFLKSAAKLQQPSFHFQASRTPEGTSTKSAAECPLPGQTGEDTEGIYATRHRRSAPTREAVQKKTRLLLQQDGVKARGTQDVGESGADGEGMVVARL